MSQYTVEYNILVNTNNAPQALMAFEQAVAPLNAAARTLQSVTTALSSFNKATKQLTGKPINIKVNIASGTEAKLNKILQQIRQIKAEAQGVRLSGNISSPVTRTQTARSTYRPTAGGRMSTSGLEYKVLGPTPLSSDGGAAINFMKGMGIAYGIAGAGQMVSNIVKSAVEYDNTIQTARNILSSHDNRPQFTQRFSEMESIVRQVGVETKFTAPEVADAARFLAMAGLKIEEINQAIRPIADIALIGDTDIGETADVITNIMTAYNKPAAEMRNVADVLTNTFTMSNTTLMEMAEAFKYSAALLSAGKIQFEESAAAIGILGNAGIKGSQAGTTMRTIMANLVNPTKKQRSAWESIGIDPTGKSPYEVFLELNQKNLSVDKFYQLFHKTAAQGAVALADHVRDWQEIIVENLVSQGLSSSLADAKKNTIQGLWAQVTSMFTEDGMQAFGGIQSAIKQMLRSAVDYLKQENVQNKFKEVANDLIGFVKTMKDSIKQIMGYFDRFGTIIKTYFKFQLMVWPILQMVKAVRSLWFAMKLFLSLPKTANGVFNIGTGNGSYAMTAASVPFITRTGSQFSSVFGISTRDRRMWKPLDKASMFLSGGLLPATSGNYAYMGRQAAFARLGDKMALTKADKQAFWRESVAEYKKSHYQQAKQRLSSSEFAKWKAGTLPFTQQENIAIRQAFDQKVARRQAVVNSYNSKWDQIAAQEAKRFRNQRRWSGVGSAAMGLGAGALMAYASGGSSEGILMGGLTAAASIAAIGGPAGWIGGAAIAIGSVATAMWQAHAATVAAQEAMNQYINETKTFNGLWTGKNASPAALELNLIYNKNLALNDVLREQIRLMKVLKGEPDDTPQVDGSDLNMSAANELSQHYENARHWYTGGREASQAGIDLWNKWQKVTNASQWHFFPLYQNDDYTFGYKSYLRGGAKNYFADPNGTATMEDVMAFYTQAMLEAASGTEYEKIKSQFSQRFLKEFYAGRLTQDAYNSAITEWDKEFGFSAFQARLNPAYGPHGEWVNNATYEQLMHPSASDLVQTEAYLDHLAQIVIGTYGPESAKRQTIDQYFQTLASGGEISEEFAIKVWSAFDDTIAAFMVQYADGLPLLLRQAWNPTTGQMGSQTAIEKALQFIEIFNQSFPHVPDSLQTNLLALQSRVNMFSNVLGAIAYDPATMGALPSLPDGGDVTIAGVKYTRNANGTYSYTSPIPNKDAGTVYTVTSDQIQRMMAVENSKKGNNANPYRNIEQENQPTYHPAGSSQDYKNHYKNQAAAPRQIIIKMDSLMNVESIDMTNADNAAVIANVKDQLAQALVDVVADFAASSQNLV